MVLEHVRRRSAGLPTASDYEYVGLRCDGTTFPCFTHVVPVELEDGPATLVFHDDLTSVRRAMEALRASEERFRALLEQSAEGVLVLDDKGTITEWNLAMARITGVSGAAARGRSGWDQMMELAIPEEGSPGRLERVRHGLLAALEGGGPPPLSAETSIRRTDGEVRRVGQTAFTLKLGGKPALGVLFQDITERKAAEEARERAERQLHQTQKMEALGTLSGGIAHDFNNLLSVVLVDAEVLQERLPEGDELRVLADEILSSGLRARELVRRILTFARRQEPARRPERLEAVAAEALKLLHASLAPNVAIELDAAPGTPAAQIDANQLHQVLTNLATNAAHAMGAAGGLLRVELAAAAFTTEQVAGRPELRPGRFVRLTVRDTGSGMTPETQKRIFEPFFTTKPVGQGTGLGLSIVHGIVASHDGFITVESKPGEGSAFHLHFPAHEAPAAAVAQQESPMSAVPAAALRVLLVDDEELVLRASGRMLSKKGLVVTPFSSPKAAVAAFTADPSAFDAALIDLAMPEMSGLELAARLTAARPGFPVLLASGNASAVGAEQARSAGIKEIVGKPYDAKTLLDAVERATRGA
jgi:PAS domain S-box-containing protein